jgi:hypothetical protein
MYPAIMSGALASRCKLRLCKDHYQGFWDQLNLHAQNAADPPLANLAPLCYLCEKEVGGTSSALYVTCYDQGSERQDWHAPLHDNCVTGAAADWLIDPETA